MEIMCRLNIWPPRICCNIWNKTWNLSCYPLIWPCTVTSLLPSWYDLRMHRHVWALRDIHLSFSSSFFFPSLSISGSRVLSLWYLYTYEATMHGNNNNKPTKRCCCHCKNNKSADIHGDFLEHEKEMSKYHIRKKIWNG